ncbi:hypoxanthine-guanine phosphoribosyltransferase [Lysobacteraceae bacterium NML75-0749]|nr:hypoxanthine-guanine phosphoribosyltransferase [Xanthomonadaceae bacterium NML75-0749]
MSADLKAALQSAQVLYSHPEIQHIIQQMAGRIHADYQRDVQPPLFLTVMNGALPFAAELALALGERGLDLQMDYLHATRYRGDTRGKELHWLRQPEVSLAGRRVLLVDDILDEGQTLLEVKHWCAAQGATEVRIAVLAVKRHDRCVPGICADYAGLEVPDRYVFGYGMDYHEQGRNLPAIYALKD